MHANADIDPSPRRRHTVLRAAAALLGILWALPLTLPGMLLGIPIVLCHGRLHLERTGPALIISGPFADVLLAHHPFGAMSAMAIGHLVIAEQHGMTRQILTHELTHVRQAALWGIFFPFAYIAASLWARLRGHDAYWHNVFEIAARKAERH